MLIPSRRARSLAGTPASSSFKAATIYRWRKKYGGLDVSEAKRLKQLEDENGRLKRIVADLTLDKQMLQDVLSRKW